MNHEGGDSQRRANAEGLACSALEVVAGTEKRPLMQARRRLSYKPNVRNKRRLQSELKFPYVFRTGNRNGAKSAVSH